MILVPAKGSTSYYQLAIVSTLLFSKVSHLLPVRLTRMPCDTSVKIIIGHCDTVRFAGAQGNGARNVAWVILYLKMFNI